MNKYIKYIATGFFGMMMCLGVGILAISIFISLLRYAINVISNLF